MRPMEEIMSILHFEKDPKRYNTLEEIEIMKATIRHQSGGDTSSSPGSYLTAA
jgi:hypothetical protein